ncbi:hypothetical protein [Butyrivibrio sp. AE2032]|uniref:hypothetical protein n=1 Tax=Butyrivibrio sp. AE2032 TaxID=1458463 RepID=UPI0005516127|nr:hypothetical protein [Butyrivibrio sp. AE2032]
MRIFEIIDDEERLNVGTLLYYEKEKDFIIELAEGLDEWNAPLLFTKKVKEGALTIPRDLSKTWVRERVIPSGRQNIGSILSTHRLKEYDEMKLLELAQGRCSQDSLFINKLDSLPNYVLQRQKHNLNDVTVLEENSILCFFADGLVRKVPLETLKEIEKIESVLKNRPLFETCAIGVGGYYLTFNDSIDVSAQLLRKKGKPIPLDYRDFLSFVKRSIVDTTSSCSMLGCSRQNLSYLVGQGQLDPIKENVKGNLYAKKDIEKLRW